MRNLYDVRAIDPGADDEQINEAFQNLAKVFHPDLKSGRRGGRAPLQGHLASVFHSQGPKNESGL